jgi:hypothetical protein
MFTMQIIDSDAFLDMPLSTQSLYFHLNMRADDDGFVNNPKKIIRMIGASEDDLKILIMKRFVIGFEAKGILVIKHWRMNNYLRKDRYHPTQYQDELHMLGIKENGAYTENKALATNGIPDGNQLATEVSIGKDSVDKDSIDKRFTPPTLEEVKAYCEERHNHIDAERFIDFYQAKGWMVGKNKMKDWKACIRTWEKREQPKAGACGVSIQDHGADDLDGIL